MKRLAVVLATVTVLGLGVSAFAFGPGYGHGWFGGGHMMNGYGYGGMTGGYGMGPGMMGWTTPYTANPQNKEFLDKTTELRRQLHDKRFEYFEALRNPETRHETIEKLQREIFELQEKLYTQAPRTVQTGAYYYGGPCWR